MNTNHTPFDRAGIFWTLLMLAGGLLITFTGAWLLPGITTPEALDPSPKSVTGDLLTGSAWVKPLLMFLVMVAGMFFNQLFENLKQQKEAGRTTTNVLQLFTKGWKGISFWMALVVSPIIFYGTYYLVDSLPDGNVAYFYAFQNGFFWYNIFNKFDTKTKKEKLVDP